MRYPTLQRLLAVAAAVALAIGGAAPGLVSAQTPAAGPSVDSVVLAHGYKDIAAFGQGDLTPIDPGTAFLNTDLPYAIIKVKNTPAEFPVTLRLVDPTGVASYSVDVKTPKRRDTKPWQSFDFGAPLYILGTDLEGMTGTWHFQVVMNGQTANDTAFQWQPATVLMLPKIKDAVNQNPLLPNLHWRYGAALALFTHDSEAISELQHAIQLDPKYALYHISLGRVYEREGKKADAMREFQTALSAHGSFYDAVFAAWAQAHLNRLKASQ